MEIALEVTPLIDAYLDEARKILGEDATAAEAIEWILLDISMYPATSEAYGRLSPVAREVLRRSYAAVGGEPGDIIHADRPYRGAFRSRVYQR